MRWTRWSSLGSIPGNPSRTCVVMPYVPMPSRVQTVRKNSRSALLAEFMITVPSAATQPSAAK